MSVGKPEATSLVELLEGSHSDGPARVLAREKFMLGPSPIGSAFPVRIEGEESACFRVRVIDGTDKAVVVLVVPLNDEQAHEWPEVEHASCGTDRCRSPWKGSSRLRIPVATCDDRIAP